MSLMVQSIVSRKLNRLACYLYSVTLGTCNLNKILHQNVGLSLYVPYGTQYCVVQTLSPCLLFKLVNQNYSIFILISIPILYIIHNINSRSCAKETRPMAG